MLSAMIPFLHNLTAEAGQGKELKEHVLLHSLECRPGTKPFLSLLFPEGWQVEMPTLCCILDLSSQKGRGTGKVRQRKTYVGQSLQWSTKQSTTWETYLLLCPVAGITGCQAHQYRFCQYILSLVIISARGFCCFLTTTQMLFFLPQRLTFSQEAS